MTFTPDTWIQAAIAAANRQAEDTGGASSIFWVTLTATWDEVAGTVYTSDKTVAEIITAYNAGQMPVAIRAEEDEGAITDGAPRIAIPTYFGDGEVYFSAASYDISDGAIGAADAASIIMQEGGENGDIIEVNAGSYEFPSAE